MDEGSSVSEKTETKSEKRAVTSPNASFYMGSNKWAWKEFLEITKREGENASTKLTKFIVNYVETHGPGNPQTLMSSFGEGGDQTVATVEGRVRQLSVEMHHKAGILTWSFIIATIKDNGIKDARARVAMAERVRDWLRGRDVGVYQ